MCYLWILTWLMQVACVKLQSLPFFPQTSTIAPFWSSSISYCDPGMVSFSRCSVSLLYDVVFNGAILTHTNVFQLLVLFLFSQCCELFMALSQAGRSNVFTCVFCLRITLKLWWICGIWKKVDSRYILHQKIVFITFWKWSRTYSVDTSRSYVIN